MLPCGTYPDSYESDKAIIRTRLQWIVFVSFLILILVLPLFLSERLIGMLNMTAIILVAVVGLQITTGYAGQVNLGQASFVGMGAFVSASLASNLGLPFWLAIPAGGIGAAIYGSLFGIPAARVKGFYLALTTLAAQFLFIWLQPRIPGFGGAGGLGVPAPSLGGFKILTTTSQYYFIMVFTVVMVFLAYGIVRSRFGRAFTAIRDNDVAAQILGINLFYYKTLAFVIGTFYAGVAGGLLGFYLRFVTSEQFVLFDSLWYLGMLVVGGMGSILGAILGTFVLRGLLDFVVWLGPMLAEALPAIGDQAWFAGMNLVLGGAIILVLMFEPRGLVHRWNIFKNT